MTALQRTSKFDVHPMILSEWKKHFLKIGSQISEKPKIVTA